MISYKDFGLSKLVKPVETTESVFFRKCCPILLIHQTQILRETWRMNFL